MVNIDVYIYRERERYEYILINTNDIRQNKSGITTLNLYRTLQFRPQTFGGHCPDPDNGKPPGSALVPTAWLGSHVMLESLC